MKTPMEAIVALDEWRAGRPSLISTSFSEIDELTGGFVRGHVWIITGTPTQGRSTLATQWACQLATRYALRTDIVSGRDTEDLVAARLLASHRRLPLTSLRSRHSASGSDPRLRKAREDLTKVPLRIAGPRQLSSLSVEPFDDVMPEALVVDDADLAAGAEPHRIADIAAKGVLVILTLPRQLVIRAEGIDPTWSRLADVILDIDRPDLRIKHSARPGEADIDVVRNRWGPQRIVTVLFEGHYARFVEMAP